MDTSQQQAEASVYYERTTLGKVRCSLCDAVCRDAANFLVHMDGKNHQSNLARVTRRERLRKLQEDRMRQQHTDGAGRGGAGGGPSDSLAVPIAPHGRPEHRVHLEPMPDIRACKVWIDAFFPAAPEDSRPMHRWVNSFEQTQEPPEKGTVYLLIACTGYETIALKFPAYHERTNERDPAGRYACTWDPVTKKFTLFFMME